MKKIGLLSDTHHYLDDAIFRHFECCDEIWHAGDFGTYEVAEKLKSFKPLRGVYGNIDGQDIRAHFPLKQEWLCENVSVLMTHIGGSPPRYNPATRKDLEIAKPRLFICGHSHILKIVFDKQLQCLYMNPGAAGNQGWHKIRTIVRFEIDQMDMRNCEVIELGRRGS